MRAKAVLAHAGVGLAGLLALAIIGGGIALRVVSQRDVLAVGRLLVARAHSQVAQMRHLRIPSAHSETRIDVRRLLRHESGGMRRSRGTCPVCLRTR